MVRNGELRRLLDLCDEIRALRRKIQDPALETEAASRLKRRSREKLKRLAADLSSCEFRGSLGTLFHDMEPGHFLVLATLLRRHLRATTPHVEGRALLSAVFDSSYDLLEGVDLLQPDGLLRAHGLVLVEHDEDATGETDLLECRFRLADAVVDGFLEEMEQGPGGGPAGGGPQRRPRRRDPIRPYRGPEDFLVDQKLLHNLYRARAKRLFGPETWWRLRGGAGDRTERAIDRRIASFEARIERRLARSPQADEFPLPRLAAEFGLLQAEVLIVLHLLFLELFDGNPYADAVALIQLVSGSEEELLENGKLFRPDAPLRRCDLVELDEMIEGRELTSECHLSNWVIERVLGDGSRRGPIDADERLNFHLYLKRLGSSNFLKDL